MLGRSLLWRVTAPWPGLRALGGVIQRRCDWHRLRRRLYRGNERGLNRSRHRFGNGRLLNDGRNQPVQSLLHRLKRSCRISRTMQGRDLRLRKRRMDT